MSKENEPEKRNRFQGSMHFFIHPGFSLRSNPGLKLANAFGVSQTDALLTRCTTCKSQSLTAPVCSRLKSCLNSAQPQAASDWSRLRIEYDSSYLIHLPFKAPVHHNSPDRSGCRQFGVTNRKTDTQRWI